MSPKQSTHSSSPRLFTKLLGSLSPKAPKSTHHRTIVQLSPDALLDLRDISSSLLQLPRHQSSVGSLSTASSFESSSETDVVGHSCGSNNNNNNNSPLPISSVIACRSHGDYSRSEVFEPPTLEGAYETADQDQVIGETTKIDIDLML
mmetsp:Transcript_6135/g.12599  ORF Transcript_6135/g.12599 Transcript_6135/m.12599 type:complete len:148 (-) Transcript_6135:140-583(-)